MGVSYAQEMRDRVLAAYDRGMKTKQIADLFQVSPAWARRVKQRRRECGETTPRPRGGITVVKIDEQQLLALVRRHPDATIKELHQMLGVDCAESTIGMALKRLMLTLKKRSSMRPSRTGRTSPRGARNGSKRNRSTPHDA